MEALDEACRLIEQAKRVFEAETKQNQLAALSKKVSQLESENRALKRTVAVLQEKRKQDRDRVRQWENAFSQSQEALPAPKHSRTNWSPSDVITQLASEPVTSQTAASQVGASQLPMSSQPIISASLPLESDDVPSDIAIDDLNGIISSSPVDTHSAAVEPAADVPDDPALKALLNRDWHPSDFIVNPDHGRAYTEVVRGNKRQCLHGRDCEDCAKFYDMLGERGAAAIQKASRHREEWTRQETPPGFWRSDFVDTQQHAKEKGDLAAKRAVEANHRLEEALNGGKYLFRDRALREMVNGLRK